MYIGGFGCEGAGCLYEYLKQVCFVMSFDLKRDISNGMDGVLTCHFKFVFVITLCRN